MCDEGNIWPPKAYHKKKKEKKRKLCKNASSDFLNFVSILL